jgi:hypothetical protein
VVELEDSRLQLIRVLVGGAVAWQSPRDLTELLGWNIEDTSDVLASLDDEGWLQVWDQEEDGVVVALSPLGAERIGMRIAEFGASETARWVSMGDPDPPLPRAKHVCTQARAAALNYVEDPQLGPELAALRAEELSQLAKVLAPDPRSGTWLEVEPPWPSCLLGVSLTPWPGPRRDPQEECPACGRMPLKPNMYCLYCDRWGLDGVFPTACPPRLPSRARPSRAHDPKPAELEAIETEEARRQRRARRRARRTAQKEEDKLRNGRSSSKRGGGTPLAGPGAVE